MPFIPAGEYLPDQADYNNPGASTITNVYPRTPGSYGPIGGLSQTITALTARCQGAAGFRDSSGNGNVFAGDATKLYLATSASSAWANVSKAAGYTITADEFWRFAQFGDNIIAHNISDPAQSYVIGTSALFADLSASAPKFRYSAVVRDFFVVGNTNDASNGAKPQRVWWAAINDPTNWPALGSTAAAAAQSDAQDVVGDHGWLTGIVSNVGAADAVVCFERAMFRMMYVGAPDVFAFYPMHGVRGCAAPGSIAQTENGFIYLGPDDFYLNDGQQSTPLGFQKVAKTFYSDLNQTFLNRITAACDPINKLYWVAYPSNGSATGNPDSLLVCAYALPSVVGTPGKWAKVTGINLEYLFKSVSFGYNEETIGNTGYNTDTAPFGPDSRVWTGGAQEILTAFDSTNTMAYFNGTNLAATVETSETQLVPGSRAVVTNTQPMVDGGTPTITPYTRNRLIDTATAGSAASLNADGFCPVRADARYHRFRMALLAGDSFTHIQGVFIPDDAVSPSGTR